VGGAALPHRNSVTRTPHHYPQGRRLCQCRILQCRLRLPAQTDGL